MDSREKLLKLKKEKNAVILAHYYTNAEVQEVADEVGDSLVLSEKAAKTNADIILFAGVRFMAETAKILSPNKRVLLVDSHAGCSLADSCNAEEFAEFLKNYPGHTVVSYVNTTCQVKALTDIIVTSSNAVQIVDSLPKDAQIVFGPDKNLGRYVEQKTGRKMVIWDGACHVHQNLSPEEIIKLKNKYPNAKVLAHPECPQSVLSNSDVIGSTAALLKYSKQNECKEYIIATENGIIYQMQKASPQKKFHSVPLCGECQYMKMNTIDKMVHSLENMTEEILLDSTIIEKAQKPINRMLTISKELGLL